MTLIQKMATVLVVSLVIGFIAKSYAEPVNAGNLTIDNTFTRATVPGQKNAGGFLSIANKGADDKLISATSNVASEVQIHEMKMDGNVMQMRQINGLAVPAKGKVELKPGGYHLMLMGLKSPLKAGDTINVQLKFEKAGAVNVKLPVQEMKPMHGGH